MVKFFFAIILTLLSYSFAYEYVLVNSVTVAKKLEIAPVAYYGSLITSNVYSQDKLPWVNFDKEYPDVYKSFMEWSELKAARMQRDLADAPENVRKTFELRLQKESNGFYLIHNIIHVDKIYDKESKTWVDPPTEKTKKVFTQFAYMGPDVLKDSSSFKLIQRVITVPAFDSEIPNKRIFFLDGVSESVAFFDIQSLENVQFFPYRLNYSVEPNPAIEVRKRIESLVYAGDYATAVQLADSADLSPRSKILLKYLTRDYEFILNKDSASNYLVRYSTYRYEDGLDLLLNRVAEQDYHEIFKCEELQNKPEVNKDLACPVMESIALGKMMRPLIEDASNFSFGLGADFGIPFLAGDFPDYKSFFFFNVALDFRIYNVMLSFEFNTRSLDEKCDSCGFLDYGIHSMLGYRVLKTKYFEGVAFANLGKAFYVVRRDGEEKRENKQESYFRYGFGAYVDYLFPRLVGKTMPEGDPIAGRIAIRLKAGFHNMKASKYGHSKGISPYISLGFRLRGDGVKLWNVSDFAKLDVPN
ncbi:hypothetical protein [Fibrobacter sp. UBA4297]|uniref:hypothetical protein n=1 Tax=Fibrobacter sp. UBA4297 TaxID=1946536 RepID=UPI0025B875AC|nr:hypothetical protein [Fibrobacter sp. UBA4297]